MHVLSDVKFVPAGQVETQTPLLSIKKPWQSWQIDPVKKIYPNEKYFTF